MFRLLIIIYVAFISLGLPDSILGSVWPQMYQDLGVNLGAAGLISAIVTCGTVISSLFSGRLIHRLGTGKVTAISVAMTAAALLGFSFAAKYWVLCAFAVLLGLGAGSVDAALNNFVALHYSARHMSWLHCFWGLGATLGPVIMSAWMTHTGSWGNGYRCIGILQSVLVVILFVSLPMWKRAEPERQADQGKKNPDKKEKKPHVLRIPGVASTLASFFFYCAVELSAGLWGSSFLVKVRGVTEKEAAKWIALYYFGITLGRLLSGFLAGKLSDRALIRLGQCVAGAGILFLFIPGANEANFFGLILIGLGCAPIYPCTIHETPNRFGKENSERLIGLQMAVAYTGNMLIPPFIGFLSERLSLMIFPWCLLIMMGLQTFCTERANRVSG